MTDRQAWTLGLGTVIALVLFIPGITWDAPAEWAGRPPFMAALGMVIFILAVVLVFSPWAREAD